MPGEPHAPKTCKCQCANAVFTLVSGEFPSLKARHLLRVLGRLGYRVAEHRGSSHRWLEAEGYPRVRFAYHDRGTVPPGIVRRILIREVGLTLEEALKVLHDD